MAVHQLNVTSFLNRARDFFGGRSIVSFGSRTGSYTYRDLHERVRRAGGALRDLGVEPGDRVATFAWNHHRHLEMYFAVPAVGATLHTINIRLGPADIGYIIDHAGDRAVFVDAELLPAIRPVLAERPALKVVVMTDDSPVQMPGAAAYEDALAGSEPLEGFAEVDEDTCAALCYTSGTTGRPKGVPYSHRALFLHTLAAGLVDGHAINSTDTVLHVVPMFHANAWGVPLAATMAGARQVLPGPHPDAERIAGLIESEGVTYTGMVPTLAAELAGYLERTGRRPATLRAFVLGGSPPSRALVRRLEDLFGPVIHQGWGMTELAPMAAYGRVTGSDPGGGPLSQGRLLPGLEWKILDGDDRELPWDGTSAGELVVRGPWAATGYYRDPAPDSFWNGWLRTGDVASISPDGFVVLRDRKKDLIKSGGEWIASAELEAALAEEPDVVEAAVIAADHSKWQERPVALIVTAAGRRVDASALRDRLRGRFPNWWLPDRIIQLPELPRTGVGKIDKQALRARFHDVLLEP